MDIIVDANILFAALIRKSVTSELMFRDDLQLYAPEYIFAEFEKYRNVVKNKTSRSDEDFNQLLSVFERRIQLVPLEEIAPYLKQASEISPDPKDLPYLALAMKMHAAVWSNDKVLKQEQNTVKIISTHELMGILNVEF